MFLLWLCCKTDANIIREGVRFERLVAMRYLIVGIVTMKQRSVLTLCIDSKANVNNLSIYVSSFENNVVFNFNQNGLEIDTLNRHDIPRHEINQVCFYFVLYVYIVIS